MNYLLNTNNKKNVGYMSKRSYKSNFAFFFSFLLYFFYHFFLEKRIHDKSEGNVLEITETKKTKQRKTEYFEMTF